MTHTVFLAPVVLGSLVSSGTLYVVGMPQWGVRGVGYVPPNLSSQYIGNPSKDILRL